MGNRRIPRHLWLKRRRLYARRGDAVPEAVCNERKPHHHPGRCLRAFWKMPDDFIMGRDLEP